MSCNESKKRNFQFVSIHKCCIFQWNLITGHVYFPHFESYTPWRSVSRFIPNQFWKAWKYWNQIKDCVLSVGGNAFFYTWFDMTQPDRITKMCHVQRVTSHLNMTLKHTVCYEARHISVHLRHHQTSQRTCLWVVLSVFVALSNICACLMVDSCEDFCAMAWICLIPWHFRPFDTFCWLQTDGRETPAWPERGCAIKIPSSSSHSVHKEIHNACSLHIMHILTLSINIFVQNTTLKATKTKAKSAVLFQMSACLERFQLWSSRDMFTYIQSYKAWQQLSKWLKILLVTKSSKSLKL